MSYLRVGSLGLHGDLSRRQCMSPLMCAIFSLLLLLLLLFLLMRLFLMSTVGIPSGYQRHRSTDSAAHEPEQPAGDRVLKKVSAARGYGSQGACLGRGERKQAPANGVGPDRVGGEPALRASSTPPAYAPVPRSDPPWPVKVLPARIGSFRPAFAWEARAGFSAAAAAAQACA